MKIFQVLFRGSYHQVLVDDEDATRIEHVLISGSGNRKKGRRLSYVPAWKNRGFRPAIWYEGKLHYLSRWILGVEGKDKIVDHIDQDPLNNQKNNLRVVGRRENAYNSGKMGCDRKRVSKYRGVIWSKQCNRWQAYIHLPNGRTKSSFHKTEEEAARARDTMLIEILRVNDCLNFKE